MKPIKNVFPACEGSEKGYSGNGSERTLMLVGQKWDEDKTPVMSAILNCFDFVPKTHQIAVLLEIVVLANSKKNRNIKSNDVNLISAARAQLLEAWLALTSVKYLDNVLVLILLNQWLKLTMLWATQPWSTDFCFKTMYVGMFCASHKCNPQLF